ncbi:hypothetical protein BD779DRAFT_1669149 [Infundibulicybe gibba]|nr:hypothetical protein BD779DRAFT_1669149 [Infundibulicybe gibba]
MTETGIATRVVDGVVVEAAATNPDGGPVARGAPSAERDRDEVTQTEGIIDETRRTNGGIGIETMTETAGGMVEEIVTVTATTEGSLREEMMIKTARDVQTDLVVPSLRPLGSNVNHKRLDSAASRVPPPRLNLDPDAPDQEEGEEMDAVNDDDAAMMAMMGMQGFGSTKGKQVDGNQEGSVAVKKMRTWRQYMNRYNTCAYPNTHTHVDILNRRGGFNRPLDKIK